MGYPVKRPEREDPLELAIGIYLNPDKPVTVGQVASVLQSRGVNAPYEAVRARIEDELRRCMEAARIWQERSGTRAWAAEQAGTDRITFEYFLMYAGIPQEKSTTVKKRIKKLTLEQLLRP